MSDDSTEKHTAVRPDRRRFIAGGAALTGAAWAAPAIRSSVDIAWGAGTVNAEYYGPIQQTFSLPAGRTVQFVLVGGGGGSGQNSFNVNDAGVDTTLNPQRVGEGRVPGRTRRTEPGFGMGAHGGAGTRLEGTFSTGGSPMTIKVQTGAGGAGAPRLNGGPVPGDGTRGGKGGTGYTNGGNGGLGAYISNSNLWNYGDGYLGPSGFFELYGGGGGGGGGSSAIWSVDGSGTADGTLTLVASGGGGGGGAGNAWVNGNGRPLNFDSTNGSGYRISSAGGVGGSAASALGNQSSDAIAGTAGTAGVAGHTGGGATGTASGPGAGGAGGSTGAGAGGAGTAASVASGGGSGNPNRYAGGGGGGGGGGASGGAAGAPGVAGTGSGQGTPGGGGGGSGSVSIEGAVKPVNIINPGGNQPGPPNNGNVAQNVYAGQWGPHDESAAAAQVPAQSWNGNPGYFRIYLL